MARALKGKRDIYGGKDPLQAPAYTVSDAASFLGLPESTVRSWVLGRPYRTSHGQRTFRPVVRIADEGSRLLSFTNLVEVHVLAALRRDKGVRLAAVRDAVSYLERRIGTDRPLARRQMLTDGKDLFIEHYGSLINVSSDGQLALKKVLERYLDRIERDPKGVPIRLFPFTAKTPDEVDRPVSIDPRIQFGRPCLAGTGVPTAEVADRFKALESISSLARDFGCSESDIEAAIRYEIPAAA